MGDKSNEFHREVCSRQGICRGDRAHEDAAGSAVDVDEAFTADGGSDEGSGGALYGEIKVGGPADGEVSIDFQDRKSVV